MGHFEFDDVERVFIGYPLTSVLAYQSILIVKISCSTSCTTLKGFPDSMISRYRTWRFSHILYTYLLPQASSGLAPSNTSTETPEDIILRLFQDILLTHRKTDCVPFASLPFRVR
jgi:hypothetical protein